MSSLLKNFYKKSISDRKSDLLAIEKYDASLDVVQSESVFNNMIENFITTYEVPLGVAPDFLIDGKIYHIPMATEEASVIAGASHAAKIIQRNNGFKINSITREMIGQIIFKKYSDVNKLKNFLDSKIETFINIAKEAHPSIYSLGGGVTSFKAKIISQDYVCLYLNVNTLDAMGANTVNTILEAISNYIRTNFDASILMSILSNLATSSLVTASVEINPLTLKNSNQIHFDIEEAYIYASLDPYRAATHNKGVMNGITALMLATGNDTRAVESGIHAYASLDGHYKPVTSWRVVNNMLVGTITIPLTLGTVGGSMNNLNKAKLSRKILGISSALELMKVTACLGLAQNFAALYALTTDGINKGHMRLHARNIAVEAGAKDYEIEDVVNHLISTNDLSIINAKNFLNTK